MEILERGKLPSEQVYVCTCGSCKSKLRFTQSEATVHYDQRDGDYVWVKCPVCSSTITHYVK